jgi:hypothetical protein
MSSHKSIIGITDDETVKLDFDQMPFPRVKYWAFWALKRFKLQGFIILKSSKNCYHVLFDRTLLWTDNMSAVAWVALLSHNEGLKRYLIMQCIKKCSTVRVSAKNEKASPRVVYRCGSQSENIREFLKNRQLIKKVIVKL